MSNHFPSVRYHRELPHCIVTTPEESSALGSEWATTPAAFVEPETASEPCSVVEQPIAPTPEQRPLKKTRRKK